MEEKECVRFFDGFNKDKEVTKLTLNNLKTFENGAIWLKYKVK